MAYTPTGRFGYDPFTDLQDWVNYMPQRQEFDWWTPWLPRVPEYHQPLRPPLPPLRFMPPRPDFRFQGFPFVGPQSRRSLYPQLAGLPGANPTIPPVRMPTPNFSPSNTLPIQPPALNFQNMFQHIFSNPAFRASPASQGGTRPFDPDPTTPIYTPPAGGGGFLPPLGDPEAVEVRAPWNPTPTWLDSLKGFFSGWGQPTGGRPTTFMDEMFGVSQR